MYTKGECGCKVVSAFLVGNTIEYCPLHKAAPDLYEACKVAKWCAEQQLIGSASKVNWQQIISDLEQVLAKADDIS